MVEKGQGAHFSSFLPVWSLYISHSVVLSVATARIMQYNYPASANTYFP